MKTQSDAVGKITDTEMYTISALCRQLGFGAATLRAARRAGLKVHYIHRQGFIHGKDWIEYVVASAERREAQLASHRS
ncbi:hypothetical protein BH11PLA2_BH11PLA2_38460 [soil metagenome]